MTARYINAFKPHVGPHSPEPAVYETDAWAQPYRGLFTIYRRLPQCWDLVIDGVCIAQRGGPDGCKRLADAMLDDPGDPQAVRAFRLLAGVDR